MSFFIKPSPPYKDHVRKLLPTLSESEQAEVVKKREMVLTYLPEAVSFIKDLHEAGLIDGWRSVEKVELIKGKDHGTD